MDIKEYEDLVREDITKKIRDIIESNRKLPIQAKSRAGAEISDFLESTFVDSTKGNDTLTRSEKSPEGKTKNPWDARTFHRIKDHEEEVWIDFKAFKVTGRDSNPDIGTPDKLFAFMEEGGFYLLYIHVFYKETEEGGIEFVERNGEMVKSYYLKDVHSSFRRTPANQLQINIDAPPQYRTREEFIKLLNSKLLESYQRQIEKAQKRKQKITENEKFILERNAQSLKRINDIQQG